MSEGEDWNSVFSERKAAQDLKRAKRLRKSKSAVWFTSKERFKGRKFKKLYTRLSPDDVGEQTPWETLIKESEYDYYVVQKDIKRLEEYVKQLLWLDGFS